jgi:hypothetical protein
MLRPLTRNYRSKARLGYRAAYRALGGHSAFGARVVRYGTTVADASVLGVTFDVLAASFVLS